MTEIYYGYKNMRCKSGPLMTVFIIKVQPDDNIPFFFNYNDTVTTRREIAQIVGLDTRTLTEYLRDEYHCLTSEFSGCYGFLDLANCEAAVGYLKTLLVSNEMRRY